MNKFESYLRENRLNPDEAAKILGINAAASAEDVKQAFRRASSKAHPDKGGTDAEMQAVNAAYGLLKNGFRGKAVSTMDDWKARKEAYNQAGAQIVSWFERAFRVENFQKYFKEVFGQDFDVEYHPQTQGLDSYASATWKFKSKDNEVWFEVYFVGSTITYFHERSKLLTGNPDSAPIAFSASVKYMTNNRKQNVAARDYSSKTDTAILTNPEILLPRAKLDKGKANTSSKFARRHFETALKAKAKVSQNKDHYFIDLPGGMQITLWRSTFLKTAAYTFIDVRDTKQRGVRERLSGVIPETEEALTGLIALLKKMENAPLSQFPNAVKAFADSFRH